MSPLVTKFNRCVTTVSELPPPLSELLFAHVDDASPVSSAVMISISGDDVAGAPMSVRGYAYVVAGSRLVQLQVDSCDPAVGSARHPALVVDPSTSARTGAQLLEQVCASADGVSALSPMAHAWDLDGAELTPGPWELHVSCADGASVTIPARSEILAAVHAGAGSDFPAR